MKQRRDKPTWGPKAWVPVRRGPIYCSPACGAKCLHVDYERAVANAEVLLARMTTPGWRVRVWENCAWHYGLERDFIQLCVVDKNTANPSYFCLIGSAKRSVGGCAHWHNESNSTNPNTAVRLAGIGVMRYFQRTNPLRKFLETHIKTKA